LGEISLSSQAENVRSDLTLMAGTTLHYASQTPNCRFKLHERSQLFIRSHNEMSGALGSVARSQAAASESPRFSTSCRVAADWYPRRFNSHCHVRSLWLRLLEKLHDGIERRHELLLTLLKTIHLLRSEASGGVHQSFELITPVAGESR
jgi:hypothetical protein